jgi:hypothetical protein
MHFSQSRGRTIERGHPHYIRLKLHDVAQLFNSMDPSPFLEKDLDEDAEEFIVSWAQEFPADDPVRLHIYLEHLPPEEHPKELIKAAVHNYFAHRAEIADLEFKRLLAQGRVSLVIGLVFLSVCLVLSKAVLGSQNAAWAVVVREGLTIVGWVAMWRPMQIYLYDWWPLRRRERIFEKLSHMPVEIEVRARSEGEPKNAAPSQAEPLLAPRNQP